MVNWLEISKFACFSCSISSLRVGLNFLGGFDLDLALSVGFSLAGEGPRDGIICLVASGLDLALSGFGLGLDLALSDGLSLAGEG